MNLYKDKWSKIEAFAYELNKVRHFEQSPLASNLELITGNSLPWVPEPAVLERPCLIQFLSKCLRLFIHSFIVEVLQCGSCVRLTVWSGWRGAYRSLMKWRSLVLVRKKSIYFRRKCISWDTRQGWSTYFGNNATLTLKLWHREAWTSSCGKN